MDFQAVQDSGDRTEFSTGAHRDSVAGKGRYDLLPTEAIRRVARHFENGATKYGDNNWRKGIPLRRYMDSLLRHAFKFLEGQTDEDHLAACIWNGMCLLETQHWIDKGRLPPELDDLFAKPPGSTANGTVSVVEALGVVEKALGIVEKYITPPPAQEFCSGPLCESAVDANGVPQRVGKDWRLTNYSEYEDEMKACANREDARDAHLAAQLGLEQAEPGNGEHDPDALDYAVNAELAAAAARENMMGVDTWDTGPVDRTGELPELPEDVEKKIAEKVLVKGLIDEIFKTKPKDDKPWPMFNPWNGAESGLSAAVPTFQGLGEGTLGGTPNG